jgi:hypothetical protein
MTTYTSVFGGANIYPSEISYSALTLDADVTLSWPEETSTSENLATRIIDVVDSSGSFSIFLPDAQKAGTGETILFNNKSADIFVVKSATGVQVVNIASGTLWQIYLTDNTSEDGNWETLQYGAATSNANASALAGTGIVAVGALLSQSVPITGFSSNYSAGATDRAKMFNWTSTGAGVLTLPVATTAGNNWFCYLRNSGDGAIVATPQGSNLINEGATVSFQPGDSAIIACDGIDFYTIGFGQNAVFAFDYTVIDVSGTGNYTLAGSELNRIAYSFTGVLTGNRTIIVPATVQQYWVTNSTTGAFTLTVKTSAGTGEAVTSGQQRIFYCNGTNVVSADNNSSGLSVPVTIAQGGTEATTAGGALINLGGGSTGISIFESSTQADAYSALGVAQAGNIDGGAF